MTDTQKLCQLALPALGENVLQMLMGILDSYVIAQLGVVAVSGVAMANQILSIYQALFIAVGAATASLMARNYRDSHLQEYYYSQAVGLSLGLSILLGLLSIVLGGPILSLLGANEEVVASGSLYLGIVGGGSFSLALLTILGTVARVRGMTRLPFTVSLVTVVLNALLSLLALFYFDWGIAGVAVATVLSRVTGIWILQRHLGYIGRLNALFQRLDKSLLAAVLPSAAERLMMRMGDVVVLALIATLGTAVLAGYAIGEALAAINHMPGLAFATATVILVGQASERERLRLIRTSYLLTASVMFLISGVIFLLGDSLSSSFTENAQALSASQTVLRYSFLGSVLTAGTLIYTAVWQGIGQAKYPLYATTLGMWGVRVLLGYLLVQRYHLGLSGVWLATLLDNFWRFAFLAYRYKSR